MGSPAEDDDDPVARYTDWNGQLVYVEAHVADGTATIGETEHGGTFPVAEAVAKLREIEAPAPVVAWLQGLFPDDEG